MKRKLGEVCTFYSGTGFPVAYQGKSEGELPFYKVGDISSNVMAGNERLIECNNYVSRQDVKEIRGTIIPKNTVVFAKIGEALKLNRRALTSVECLIDNNAMGIAPNQKLLRTKYFFYGMKQLKLQNYAETTAVPSVRKSRLEKIEIEIPDLETQIYREKILDKVSVIISNRKKELLYFDELVKARFVEMFGDPVRNSRNWEMTQLNAIITNSNNGMPRRGNDDDGAIVLRLVELQKGYIDYTNSNRIILNEKEKKKYLLRDNDFLFARVNGNSDNVGRCAVFHEIGEDVYHNDHIIRVHFEEDKCNGRYMSALLNSTYGKREMRNKIKTSAGQYTISQEGIGDIRVPLPPIQQQTQFAEFVAQVEKLKAAVQRSLTETQTLFNSLMQTYFG